MCRGLDFFIGNILLSKPLRAFCLPLKSLFNVSKVRAFSSLSFQLFGLVESCLLNLFVLQTHHLAE